MSQSDAGVDARSALRRKNLIGTIDTTDGLVFYPLFHICIALAHAYVIYRIAIAPGWAPVPTIVLVGVAVMGSISVGLVWRGHGRGGQDGRWLMRFQNVWLGFVFLLFAATLGADLALAVLLAVEPTAALAGPELIKERAAAVLGLAMLITAGALYQGLRAPAIKRVELTLPGWPEALDGFRIVQISDLHIGAMRRRRFAEHVTSRVNALEPHLVAVTGDLVDGSVAQIGQEVEPFGRLSADCGVWFVCGNHDFYSGAEAWLERIGELSWRPLCNARVSIEHNGANFLLAGISDSRGAPEGRGEDLDSALSGRDQRVPLVLLAHAPRTFHRSSAMGVDLQLSGHTHGGQIWPMHWIIRAQETWIAGLHRVGDSQIYVNSGTGTWGPPMRLGTRGEITELVVRSAHA